MPNLIKNRRSLLSGISYESKKNRKMLLDIVEYVLSEVSSKNLLKKYLVQKKYKHNKNIYIIGIGKAARSMVDAALEYLPKPNKILFADTGHPLPTKKGIIATNKILALKGTLKPSDRVIVMLSGGGSSMLTSPPPGISLRAKIDLTTKLLKCGAPIQEINIVRKHLSQIKGGRLARILYPANVDVFVLSDVIGNDLSTIASGPLSADRSTFNDALKIIKKYKIKSSERIMEYLKKGVRNNLLESIKPGDAALKNVKVSVIADHFTTARLAEKFAKIKKVNTLVLKNFVMGEAREVAKKIVSCSPKNKLVIGCGETTVTVKGKGQGGRNQEFVLAALEKLRGNQTILSIGTDGVDGICPEKVAGAIADRFTLNRAKTNKLKIKNFLKNNDSYAFFKKAGGHIKTRSTNTNLGDIILCLS